MKLEKREITLNEADSLKDALLCESALLKEYAVCAVKAERKETRFAIQSHMKEIAEEIFRLRDILTDIS